MLFRSSTPNQDERNEILEILLRKHKLDPENYNIRELVQYSKDRTGAEIEQAIMEAKINAFDQDKSPTTEDIYEVFSAVIPIWATFKNKVSSPEYKRIIDSAKPASPSEST